MSVAVVQVSAAAAAFASSKSSTPTLPGNSTSGNLIILPWAHQQFDNNSTTVAASGYTSRLGVNQAANSTAAGILDKAAAGAAETPTAVATTSGTAANSDGDSVLIEVSGLASSSPFVVADSNTNTGTTTALSVASGSPLSQASGIAIAVYSSNTSMAGGSWPPAGWTDVHSNLAGLFAIAYKIFSTNAQLTAAMTVTSAPDWTGIIAIYQAATSSVAFRKTLSSIGGRIGVRQLQS